jgi:alpha-L-fucosidase
MKAYSILRFATIALFTAAPIQPATATLTNGSFEQEFSGWTKTGNLEVRMGSIYTATDGARMAVFNAAQKNPDGTLSQSFATVIGQTYTLQFDAGVLSYNTYAQTLGVTVTGAGSLLSKAITINGFGGGSNSWLPQTFNFIANSPTTTLSFQDRSSLTDSLDLLLDNVRVTGTVVGPNTAPVASADSYSAGQNTTLVISAAGVLTNDTDAQSNLLTAILDSDPGHGSVSLNANGGFTYTPATGYTGVDSFTYHANDGSLSSNSSTVTIDVVALIPGVSFPTIVGKPFIARFRVVPKDTATTVPVLRLKITGNVQLKDVELDSALPTGETSVPYYILFTADSGITTLRFITPGGDSVETGQIAGLEVTEPLTLAPSSLPNPRQQAQIDRRYGLFLHYGINTFHDLEWSDGTKPASSYNPTALDVEQWVKTACEAGMRYVLIISKHHDGFCMWDSPWTTYDVGSSPVKTNVIAAAAAACKKYGIAMGLYYSVWDRHEPSYGNDAAYNQFLLRQLEELLGSNGPVCELWLDGAWDKANSRWPCTEVYDLVRRLQPDCQVSFNGTIGNPSSPDTNATPNNQHEDFPIRYFPSDFRLSDPLFAKTPDPKIFSHDGNSYYLPFEATTMLSGYSKWFYSTYDNYNRSVSDLAAIYDSATAQNNILVLNAPPDRRGLVRDLERSTLFQLRDRVGLKSGLSLPYGSIPLTIPGKIQVEDFDTGGQGVAYNDLTTTNSGGQYRTAEGVDLATTADVDGGHQVLGTRAGEWLKYTLNVAAAGNYLVNIRAANETAGGQIYLEVDGINISGMISIPNTGSMDTWQTLALPDVTLDTGGHILRLVIAANDPNGIAGAFNWISFAAEPRPGPTAAAGQDFEVLDTDNNGFGDVALDASASIAGNSPITNFEWKEGGLLLASGVRPTLSLAIGSHLIQLVVTDGNGLSDSDEIAVTVSPMGLVNGSFEYGFQGWVTSGNQGIYSTAPYAPTNGTNLIAFNAAQSTPNGLLSQTFATTVGQTLRLDFDAGVLAYNFNSQKLQIVVKGAGEILSKTITINGAGGGISRWFPQNLTFTANSTSTTLTFRDQSASTDALDLLLDNLRITAGSVTPNTSPVAVTDSYSTDQNAALVVPDAGVLANDTDAESASLTATSVTSPAHGSLNLNPKGGFTYTPAAGYTGTDSFTYQASDGSLNSNIVSVSITIKTVVSGFFVNGSFESGFSGWMTSGNMDIRASAPYAATNGTQLVAFNSGNRTPNATLSQTFATTAGQNYTLKFDAGVIAYNTNSQLMQVTVAGTGSLLSRNIAISGLGGGANRWLPQSFTFVADSGSTNLTFRDISTSTIGLDLLLDHVRVTGTPANTAAPLAPIEPKSRESSDGLSQALTLPPSGLGTPLLSGVPGDLTIRMTAPVDGSYFLECSEDLKTWEFVTEGMFKASESIEFHDTRVPSDKSPAKTRMFYRIGFTP